MIPLAAPKKKHCECQRIDEPSLEFIHCDSAWRIVWHRQFFARDISSIDLSGTMAEKSIQVERREHQDFIPFKINLRLTSFYLILLKTINNFLLRKFSFYFFFKWLREERKKTRLNTWARNPTIKFLLRSCNSIRNQKSIKSMEEATFMKCHISREVKTWSIACRFTSSPCIALQRRWLMLSEMNTWKFAIAQKKTREGFRNWNNNSER